MSVLELTDEVALAALLVDLRFVAGLRLLWELIDVPVPSLIVELRGEPRNGLTAANT